MSKTHFHRAALALISAFLIGVGHAMIDADHDGMSDIWEQQNGFAISGTQPANQLPGADPDQDGWTNLEESQAGTNPNSSSIPTGMLKPSVLRHPEFPSVFVVSWPSLLGKQYKLQVSPDLSSGNWVVIGDPIMGTGQIVEYGMEPLDEDGLPVEKLFWRVVIENTDTDGDTFLDSEEIVLGYNRFLSDTDLDGYPDNTDSAPLISASLLSPDGAGLAGTTLVTNMTGRWDFESFDTDTTPPSGHSIYSFPDQTAGGRAATSFLGAGGINLEGMVSKATNHAGGFVTIPPSLLNNDPTYSISFWAALDEGSVENSNGQPQGLFTHHNYLPHITGGSPNWGLIDAKAYGIWVQKIGSREILRAGYYGYKNHVTGTAVTPVTTVTGIMLDRPLGTIDDGKWHHYVLLKNGASTTLFIDGEKEGPVTHTSDAIPANSYTGISLGRIYGQSPETVGFQLPNQTVARGRFDRLRAWSDNLTANEIENLYHEDTDRDGLWDITENESSLWRDADSDNTREANEVSYISSPFHWQPADTDTDGDGATDIAEQGLTKIGFADSDGDGIPDGWELKYGLNPNLPGDAALDDDDGGGDGLTNLQEYLWNTNPNKRDTDLDGTNDGPEIGAGGEPNDASDGGSVPPEERFSVTLGVGDKSGSKSETYYLHCYLLDPETGLERRVYTLKPEPGPNDIYATEVKSIFKKGQTYTFQIDWQTTTNTGKSSLPKEGPDFDYTLEVVPDSASESHVVDAWDLLDKAAHVPILAPGAGANDVADDEPEFRKFFEKARVILTPFLFSVIHTEPDPATGAAVNPGPFTIFRDEIVDIVMFKFPHNLQDRTVTLSVVEEAMRTESLPGRGSVQMYDFGSIDVGGVVNPNQTEFTLKAAKSGLVRVKAVFNKVGKLKIKATSDDGEIDYTSREFTIKERIRKYAFPYPGFPRYDANKHDQDFVDAVTDWGNFYSYPIDTVDRIKAMAVAESNVGAQVQAPTTRPNDILTIGHPDDDVLESIQGSIAQWDLDLIHPQRPAIDARYKKLDYQTAGIATTRESIYWGVLWFYVKGFAFLDNCKINPSYGYETRNQAPLNIIDGIEQSEYQFDHWASFDAMTARYNGGGVGNYSTRVNKALQSGLHFNAAAGNDKLWPIRSNKSARP
ncbi:LamG-like jellyroll fold domain-containing protein [Luteolibacter sp. Populi]|uniref:LamG-like jellyroll fold domain-containing protein n=1 Tax=Luteolibacter sp. Populi TaxID=3230487 RepID=UPI0034675D20